MVWKIKHPTSKREYMLITTKLKAHLERRRKKKLILIHETLMIINTSDEIHSIMYNVCIYYV